MLPQAQLARYHPTHITKHPQMEGWVIPLHRVQQLTHRNLQRKLLLNFAHHCCRCRLPGLNLTPGKLPATPMLMRRTLCSQHATTIIKNQSSHNLHYFFILRHTAEFTTQNRDCQENERASRGTMGQRLIRLHPPLRLKRRSPPSVSLAGFVDPGSYLLSRDLSSDYHRRADVSLPGSEWDRVGPSGYDHQASGSRASAVAFCLPVCRCCCYAQDYVCCVRGIVSERAD